MRATGLNEIEKNRLRIEERKDFALKDTLECGQCFRWKKEGDGCYTGVVKEGVIQAREEDNVIVLEGSLQGDFEEICRKYFDLDRDYGKIKKILSKEDKNMKEAVKYGAGIRILNQDPWEVLISFIISAANNIPRISKTIENLAKAFGKPMIWNGRSYYLFPTPEELAKATLQELRACNLGFRDRYVVEATRWVVEKRIDFEHLKEIPYEESKKELMKIPGVGAKVADCILLFSLEKMEAFPVDTWIKKVMSELYIESSNTTKVNQYARERFGEYAGIAQQYLFYHIRNR